MLKVGYDLVALQRDRDNHKLGHVAATDVANLVLNEEYFLLIMFGNFHILLHVTHNKICW